MDEHITAPTSNRASVSKSESELDWQFQGFAMLWSLTSLLVIWQRMDFSLASPIHTTVNSSLAIAAFCVLLRPHWVIPVVVTGALHVVFAMVQMPHIGSHELLLCFFGLAIGVSYLTSIAANRSYRVQGIAMYRSFVPPVRVMVVGSLLAVGIGRLNWGFIDIETSPVTETLVQIRGAAVTDWIVFFTISMLVIIDGFLAVSLLVPSLRRFAVGFGSVYFCWQAWMGFGEARLLLPAILLGLYAFLSTDAVAKMYATIQKHVPVPALRRAGLPIYVIVTLMVGAAIWFQQESSPQLVLWSAERLIQYAFVGLIVGWLILLLAILVDYRPRLTWVSLAPRNAAHYLLLLVFMGCLVSPYLGLGNIGKFTHGSGFATTWKKNNHLLIPQASLTEYEQDWVEIIDSSDPYLAKLAESRSRVTWFAFVNYVQPRPDTAVEFVRDGQQYQVERAGEITVLSEPNPWMWRKFTAFEPLSSTAMARLTQERKLAQP